MSPADKTRARLAALDGQLTTALESGQPTADIRAALDLARAEMARIEGQAAETAQEGRLLLEREAQALRDRDLACLEAEVDHLARIDLPPAPALPAPVGAILAARGAAEAEARASAHADRLKGLEARLGALQGQRGAIVERRAQGNPEPTDGAALSLLDADIEGVRALLVKTRAEGPGSVEAARLEAERAQAAWRRDLALVRQARLRSLAAALEARLLEVAAQLSAPQEGIPGLRYAPGPRLRGVLVRGFQG